MHPKSALYTGWWNVHQQRYQPRGYKTHQIYKAFFVLRVIKHWTCWINTKLQKITITMILYVNTKEIIDAEFIYFLFFLFISINTLLLWQHHFMSKVRNIVVGCILSNGKWFCVFVLIIILVRFIIPSLELGKKCIGCHDVNLPLLCPLHVCLFLFWWTTSLLSHWYITHICHLYTFTDICTFFYLFLTK